MRKDTKTLILNKAESLFQGRGFNGFSYQDISKPLSIKNAAIHYHFPTKADLGVALIERYRALLHRKTGDFMRNGGDPLVQLEGYFKFTLHECCSEPTMVCPIGVLAADFYTVPEAMRDEGRQLVNETLAWLTRVLALGRDQGVLGFKGRPADKALEIMACLQGARQLARISGRDLLEAAVAQVRRDLNLTS